MEILKTIWLQIIATSLMEWMIVVCGFTYLILITKKNSWGWPFAIISSTLSMFVFFNANYYLETFLSFFYLVMGIWGWITWSKTKTIAKNGNVKIVKWKISHHLLNIGLSTILTLIFGYYFDHYTDQYRPYLDAFTTIFSLAATFMVTQKVLENWIYWIIIDLVSIELYAYRELYLLATQMGIYSLLAVYGYLQWKKDMITHKLTT